jgi:L-seryl-tRNA(Ser) seleniumtransferase
MSVDLYRRLPAVDAILRDPRCVSLPREAVVAAARGALESLRSRISAGTVFDIPDIAGQVSETVRALIAGQMRPVWNATGIVLHTNLGRAPWSPLAIEAVARTAGGYCNLEIDLESGDRGGRAAGALALLRHLTGAESALIVNNCAAAVLLALTALASGREVVTSRGELVEIGGSFRIPDVVTACGARLVEVGTTNRTRLSDFEGAVRPETAVLLRVHPSNFRVIGFTEAPSRPDLIALARSRGLGFVEDIGSGSLQGAWDEPSLREAVTDGADVVLFSGDKLLGGPQAGIAVGRADAINRMAKHPMYRALRVDKSILAAVEATLAVHARGEMTEVDRMLSMSPVELAERADRLQAALGAIGIASDRRQDRSFVGGGSLPGHSIPAEVVVLAVGGASALARELRRGTPSIVARVADDAVLLDPRTLPAGVETAVAAAVSRAMAAPGKAG